MIVRSVILSFLAFASIAAPTFAADNSIAIVNVQEIMRDSTAAKSIKEQLDAKQKSFQSEMQKKEEDLQKEDQDLSKQRAVLSPEAFDKKLKEFKAKATNAQKQVQSKRAELDSAFSNALGEVQKSVFDIVAGIAKEKGYTVVFPSSQLLYGDPKFDITKEVLSKLNANLPKVSVNFKAASKDKDDE